MIFSTTLLRRAKPVHIGVLWSVIGWASFGVVGAQERFDRFGGDLRVTLTATGNFRVEQVRGRWFFITPDGHPFVAMGANHMGPFLKSQARVSGYLQRFGEDSQRAEAEMLTTLRTLGFNAGDVYQPAESYKRTLPWITFFWYGETNGSFIDVFNKQALGRVTDRAREHARSVADNQWVLGIAGPDLSVWDGKLVRRYRSLPPQAPGRKRYVRFLRERYEDDVAKLNAAYKTTFASFDELASLEKITLPSDAADDALDPHVLRWRLPILPEKSDFPARQADDDAFCSLVAATLFPAVRAAVKEGAPNHLFLGEHLALRMIPDAVIKVMARHVDAYLAQAVEVSPQRPPEWQVFQKDRWDYEYAMLQKPIVICDWGAVFSLKNPFEARGATIKPEREASDDSARFIHDAFAQPYIIGLFVCKLLGDHRNDANLFDGRATRTYLRGDGTAYEYRTRRLQEAVTTTLSETYDRIASPEREAKQLNR